MRVEGWDNCRASLEDPPPAPPEPVGPTPARNRISVQFHLNTSNKLNWKLPDLIHRAESVINLDIGGGWGGGGWGVTGPGKPTSQRGHRGAEAARTCQECHELVLEF